jgi:hypothetical protein
MAEPRPPARLAVLEGGREASVRVRTRIERTLEAAALPPRLYGKPLQGGTATPPAAVPLPTTTGRPAKATTSTALATQSLSAPSTQDAGTPAIAASG